MRVDEIIRRVQRIVGDDNEAQMHKEDIIDWINDAQKIIARETEILEGQVDLDTSATVEFTILPNDFVRDRRLTYKGVKLNRTTLAELDADNNPNDPMLAVADNPTRFYIWGDALYLYPWPKVNAPGTIHLWYVRLPVDVATGDDIPEIPLRYHSDIVSFCLATAREVDSDYDAANAKMTLFNTQVGKSKDEATATNANSYPSVRDIEIGWAN